MRLRQGDVLERDMVQTVRPLQHSRLFVDPGPGSQEMSPLPTLDR